MTDLKRAVNTRSHAYTYLYYATNSLSLVNMIREFEYRLDFLIVQFFVHFIQNAYLLSVTLNDHIHKIHTLGLVNCCRTLYVYLNCRVFEIPICK